MRKTVVKKSKSIDLTNTAQAPTIILKQGSYYAFDLDNMVEFATARNKRKRAAMIKRREVIKVVSPCLEIKILDSSYSPFLLVKFGSGTQVWIVVDGL